MDPYLYDDLLRAKDEIKKKRIAFEAGLADMDPGEQEIMMGRFDASMLDMERSL